MRVCKLLIINNHHALFPCQNYTIPSSSGDETFNISDGEDFIPQKKKKIQDGPRVKPSLVFRNDEYESDNSEVERTKALIEKLTPSKQKKDSSSSIASDVSSKAKRNLLDIASERSEKDSDIVIRDEKSSPAANPAATVQPAKKPTAAKGRAKKAVVAKKTVKDANQMTLFESTAKATGKNKPFMLDITGSEDELAPRKVFSAYLFIYLYIYLFISILIIFVIDKNLSLSAQVTLLDSCFVSCSLL